MALSLWCKKLSNSLANKEDLVKFKPVISF